MQRKISCPNWQSPFQGGQLAIFLKSKQKYILSLSTLEAILSVFYIYLYLNQHIRFYYLAYKMQKNDVIGKIDNLLF